MPKCTVDTCFVEVSPSSMVAPLCAKHFERLPKDIRNGLVMKPEVCAVATGMTRLELLEKGVRMLLEAELETVGETSLGPIPDCLPEDL